MVRTRFRKRGDEHTRAYTYSLYNASNGAFIATIPDTQVYWTLYSEISDVVGSPDAVHPVSSLSYRYNPSMVVQPFYSGTQRVVVNDTTAAIDGLALAVVVPSVANTAPWQAAVNSAFASIALQMPTEVSIGNFILEARQLKDLIPKIEGSLVRDVSNGYLTWQFGWKPLLSDLRKLANLAKTVEDRINYLKLTHGREVRASYYQDISLAASVPSSAVPSFGGYRYERVDYRGIFRANGYVYQELEGLDGDLGKIRGFISALGLLNPTKVFWENLPYSFVVDWFLDIGGLIDRLSIQPYDGLWRINRVTTSIKESYKVKVWQEQHLDDARNQRYYIGDVFVNRYTRGVGLPVSSDYWLNPSTLSSQQQLLFAALLGVRW